MLAHPGPKAIQHFKDLAVDIIVDSSELCPCKIDCETCMLAKAHKMVSLRTEGQEPANDNPFNRMTYDLIDLCDGSAYNEDNWVSYMGCAKSGFQLGTTHYTKSEALAILDATIDFVEAQYKTKVRFLRVDGEIALDKSFRQRMLYRGIVVEVTALDTLA